MMLHKKMIEKGRTFLKVQLLPIEQKGQTFYVTSIPAQFLIETYTCHPLKYSMSIDRAKKLTLEKEKNDIKRESKGFFRSSSTKDALKKINEDLTVYQKKLSDKELFFEKLHFDKGYQREASKSRVSSIASFLNKEDTALFPNTVILTAELLNDYLTTDKWDEVSEQDVLAHPATPFLDESDVTGPTLYIPKEQAVLLIVDGQHRVEGLKEAKKEITSNFDVLVSLMLKQNRASIASLFYTINHEQKPVNKSILYHLWAEFSYNLDSITFLHKLVCFLNETENSPFYNRIKMLGKTDSDATAAEKELMTLSQASIIDGLAYTISEQVTRSNLLPIFRYYYNNDMWSEILVYIALYFEAVELLRHDWNLPNESQVSKTMGVSALLKVMCDVFTIQFVREDFASQPENINKLTIDDFVYDLKGLEDIDLNIFDKQSSGAGVNKMRDLFLCSIESTKNTSILKLARGHLREWLQQNLDHKKAADEVSLKAS